MNILRFVLLICIGYSASVSSVYGGAGCSKVKSIPLKYLGPLLGQWYLSAQSSFTQGCEGLQFTGYSYPFLNFTVTENFDGSNSVETTVFVSNNTFLITNPKNPTFQPTQGPLVSFTFKIVATDYQSYFLAYSCVGSLGTSYLFTRQLNLSQAAFNNIQQQLNGLGLPNKLVKVTPTDCVASSSVGS